MGALLLQRRNLVGVAGNVEQQIGCRCQDSGQCGGKLCDEWAKGSDDGFIPRPEFVLIIFHRIEDGDHHNQVIAILTEIGEHVA